MPNKICCICNKEAQYPVVDAATGWYFCNDHFIETRKHFVTEFNNTSISDWLRAIADIMDEHAT